MANAVFECIVRWKHNRGDFVLQRLTMNADNLPAAIRRAYQFTSLMVRVGGYEPGAARVEAVGYVNAFKDWQTEHHVGQVRNKAELDVALKRALATEPAKIAKSQRAAAIAAAPVATVRTRAK